MTVAEYFIKLGIDPSSDVAKQIRKALDKTDKEVEGFFRGLKSKFGRQSTFGDIGELLTGGGAVAGFHLLGKAFADISGQAVSFRDDLRNADHDVTSIVDNFARGLPIIGGFYAAGSNLRELFTGEKAAISAANEEIKRQAQYFDDSARAGKVFSEVMQGLITDNRRLEEEMAGVKHVDTADEISKRARARVVDSTNKRIAELSEQQSAAMKDLGFIQENPVRAMVAYGGPSGVGAQLLKDAHATKDAGDQLANLRKHIAGEYVKIDDEAKKNAALQEEKAGADSGKTMSDRIRKQTDDLTRLETQARDERTKVLVDNLRSQGKTVEAQLIENYASYDQKIRELITEERRMLSESTDPRDTAGIESAFEEAIAAEREGRQSSSDRIRADAERETTKQLTDRAKALEDAAAGPLDKYRDRLIELNELMEKHVIDLDEAQRLAGAFGNEAAKALDTPYKETPQQIRRFTFGELSRPEVYQPSDDFGQKNFGESQRQTKLLEQIHGELGNLQIPYEEVNLNR